MPLRLDIQRKLSNRSERVKAVDFHPTEPWLLSALYNGNVYLWNYETCQVVKTFEASDVPIRACKFISRKSWLVTGSDDLMLKVFNYNTHEKVIAFEAHVDYIRGIAVHNTLPLVVTCSDDMTIKLWDWEKSWKNVMTFEGHTHFVMHVAFNPKDSNTFASASMDRTIKVWNLSSSVANYTLEGHLKGVNCVEYYEGGDKPYLVSGADDKLIKVWDYQNKTCVQTLEGHTNNVMRVCYHPSLPIIISGSEDGTIRIWHANTYRLENTLNYGMERVWCLAYLKGTNDVAFGYDEGTISIKLGKDEPSVSMDTSGKIVWAKHNEIQTANVQQLDTPLNDGDKLILPVKDLGSCEVYPQTLVHSPNGRFVTVCGDGEYIIYTALAWRNKSFGQALEFVWAQDSSEYAIRESTSKIKLFKSFKEKSTAIRYSYSAEGIYGGALLGVKSSAFIMLYDWETGVLVRRVDVLALNVYWSESDMVAITCQDSFYILKFNRAAFTAHIENGIEPGEEGYEDVLDFVTEIPESVTTGFWAGDCFIYTNSLNRLCYLVGDQPSTVSHFDKPMFLLGYIARDNRAFLCDKHLTVVSYSVPLVVIEYQSAVLRGDLAHASSLLPSVPSEHLNRLARFLEAQGYDCFDIGYKEEALKVTSDPEHRFELSMGLMQLNVAYDIANELNHEHKWKLLGDTALQAWNYRLAIESYRKANDLESLFLIYQTSGNAPGLSELATLAGAKGEINLALMCQFLLANHNEVIQLLIDTSRLPEAAFYARTYCPSQISRVVDLWKLSLVKVGKSKMADAIADPATFEDLFPDYQISLDMEKVFGGIKNAGMPPAAAYNVYSAFDGVDVINEIKTGKKIADIFGPLISAGHAVSRPPSPEKLVRPKSPAKEPVKAEKPKDKPIPAIMSRGKSPSPTKSENGTSNSVETPPSRNLTSPPPKTATPPPMASPPSKISKVESLPSTSPVRQDEISLSEKPTAKSNPTSTQVSPKKPMESKSFVKPTASAGSSNGSSLNGVTNGKHSTFTSPARDVAQAAPVTHDPWDTKEFIPDNTSSHMSMEVNTTGTGSVKGLDADFDDFEMDNSAPEGSTAMDDEELEKMLM